MWQHDVIFNEVCRVYLISCQLVSLSTCFPAGMLPCLTSLQAEYSILTEPIVKNKAWKCVTRRTRQENKAVCCAASGKWLRPRRMASEPLCTRTGFIKICRDLSVSFRGGARSAKPRAMLVQRTAAPSQRSPAAGRPVASKVTALRRDLDVQAGDHEDWRSWKPCRCTGAFFKISSWNVKAPLYKKKRKRFLRICNCSP